MSQLDDAQAFEYYEDPANREPAPGRPRRRPTRPPTLGSDDEYRITKAEAKKFEEAIASARERGASSDVDPRIHEATIEALESELAVLREQGCPAVGSLRRWRTAHRPGLHPNVTYDYDARPTFDVDVRPSDGREI